MPKNTPAHIYMNLEIPIVPNTNGETRLVLDMRVVYEAERRNDDISITNEHKAPELMAFFNKAYAAAGNYLNRINMEIVRAQKVANVRRAVVVLDEVPKILIAKGLATGSRPSGTDALREAILDLDEKYQNALDLVDQLRAYSAIMKTKLEHIQQSYLGVRKIIGGDRLHYMSNQNLSAGAVIELPENLLDVAREQEPPVQDTRPPRTLHPLRSKFGVPND